MVAGGNADVTRHTQAVRCVCCYDANFGTMPAALAPEEFTLGSSLDVACGERWVFYASLSYASLQSDKCNLQSDKCNNDDIMTTGTRHALL